MAAFTEIENYDESSKYIMYVKAVQLAEEGQYELAINSLNALDDFKDSKLMVIYYTARSYEAEHRYSEALEIYKKIATFRDSAKRESAFPKWWKFVPGSEVTFGRYEQDGDAQNGGEPIVWRVLTLEGDKALLISEKSLDARPYNIERVDVTWETCTLRTWLNGEFLKVAFTVQEQGAILTTAVKNEDNPDYGTDGGNDTSDKVFLLSIAEAEALFRDDASRVVKNTAYAKAQGAYTDDSGYGWWWLRSPGLSSSGAAGVNTFGSVYRVGIYVNYGLIAVRPALWLDLTSDLFSSVAP